MLKIGKQILHWSVLFLTGMALVGVNVTQSGCLHAGKVYLEVKVVPAEHKCPCEESCLCCDTPERRGEGGCHAPARHDFYKITDSSVVERNIQLGESLFFLPEYELGKGLESIAEKDEKDIPGDDRIIPEVPPSPEWLCVFIC